MQIGSLPQDLCFTSEVPLKFKDISKCTLSMNRMADYMDEDLKEKNISIAFLCREKLTPINT